MEEQEVKECSNCKRAIAVTNISTHELHCHRNITLCKICKEPYPKNEIENHIEEDHAPVKCEYCDDDFAQDLISTHKESECDKRPVMCKYCDLEYPFSEFSEHQDECGSRTDHCDVCDQIVKLSDMEKHEESGCALHTTTTNTAVTEPELVPDYFPEVSNTEAARYQNSGYHPSRLLYNPRDGQFYRPVRSVIVYSPPPASDEGEYPLDPPTSSTNDVPPPEPDDDVEMVTCEFCREEFPMYSLNIHEAYCEKRETEMYKALQEDPNENPDAAGPSRSRMPRPSLKLPEGHVRCMYCLKPVKEDELLDHQVACQLSLTERLEFEEAHAKLPPHKHSAHCRLHGSRVPVVNYNAFAPMRRAHYSPTLPPSYVGHPSQSSASSSTAHNDPLEEPYNSHEYGSGSQGRGYYPRTGYLNPRTGSYPPTSSYHDAPSYPDAPEDAYYDQYIRDHQNASTDVYENIDSIIDVLNLSEATVINDPVVEFPPDSPPQGMIPCQFCNDPFPDAELVQHQHTCPMNNVRMVTPLPSQVQIEEIDENPKFRSVGSQSDTSIPRNGSRTSTARGQTSAVLRTTVRGTGQRSNHTGQRASQSQRSRGYGASSTHNETDAAKPKYEE